VGLVRVPFYFINLLLTSLLYISILPMTELLKTVLTLLSPCEGGTETSNLVVPELKVIFAPTKLCICGLV
jgi:hypothetical protein